MNQRPKQKLAVQTIHLKPISQPTTQKTLIASQEIIEQSIIEQSIIEPPKPKELEINIETKAPEKAQAKQPEKKHAPAKIVPKKTSPKPSTKNPSKPLTTTKPAQNKTEQKKEAHFNTQKNELILKAKEKINKVQSPIKSIGTTPAIPSENLIGNLQTEFSNSKVGNLGSPGEMTYNDLLIYRLKNQLKMPEFGNIEIQLTLSRNGKLISLNILTKENSKNRAYIENNLPKLTFPPFGNNFIGESQHTFFITLCGDLNS